MKSGVFEPLVSVIMPAYNAEKTIRASIDSILSQTFTNIELLVIDDGSKDGTANIVKSYDDSRVKYFKNEKNLGLVKTLNKAIDLSSGEYVARMDADDISLPERIQYEVAYMENNKNCIICGTFARSFIVTTSGVKKMCQKMSYEVDNNKLKDELALECCFAHPTIMFRRSLFSKTKSRYDNDYLNSEDYNYWIDLMDYGEYHNIPKVLLLYRVSPTQMSASSGITILNSNRCRWRYIEKRYGIEVAKKINAMKPSTSLIRELKREGIKNKYFYKLLYLSFDKYSIVDLFYLLLSWDLFRLGYRTTFQILKRWLKGPNPVLKKLQS